MNTFFGQTFVCLIVMLKNKTRAIEDINISIALVDSWVRPLTGQCKLNDIGPKLQGFLHNPERHTGLHDRPQGQEGRLCMVRDHAGRRL